MSSISTLDNYFKKYSNLYQFEEGSPEYLIDKEDFKNAMDEYAKQLVQQKLNEFVDFITQEYDVYENGGYFDKKEMLVKFNDQDK